MRRKCISGQNNIADSYWFPVEIKNTVTKKKAQTNFVRFIFGTYIGNLNRRLVEMFTFVTKTGPFSTQAQA